MLAAEPLHQAASTERKSLKEIPFHGIGPGAMAEKLKSHKVV